MGRASRRSSTCRTGGGEIFLSIDDDLDSAYEPFEFVRIVNLPELGDEDLVFGLQFRASGDIEHRRGMKIRESDFGIVEYGSAEVALFGV
ncbi:hypothetical protein HMPREF2751_03055 [Corynebacterium sp. HMSC063G05]|uniref:hypothetical protein n=1 Tax=Corynebacterium sp. HMSC063G05 TaxID=1739255 RepID=UPI0008A22D3D|nr:hypothetical protein [Corynebacterium sp. HMSC063G05]OFL71654.1 hypothetical protein HMPREF2751_03055 [Corynebacterium sp. HMSC063G05]